MCRTCTRIRSYVAAKAAKAAKALSGRPAPRYLAGAQSEPVGLYEQLTEEQKAAVLAYDGPENHGSKAYRREPAIATMQGAMDDLTDEPRSIYASLTEQQKAAVLSYDGPESHGSSDFRIDPPLTRDEQIALMRDADVRIKATMQRLAAMQGDAAAEVTVYTQHPLTALNVPRAEQDARRREAHAIASDRRAAAIRALTDPPQTD